jgi:SAM-dependent methyltransferase
MPPHSSGDADAMTSRRILLDRQYADPGKLAARKALWALRPGPSHLGLRLDVLRLAGDETVIDVGCGPGEYLAKLRQRGHTGRLFGMDMSLGMARAAAPRASAVLVGDAVRLPLADAAVDVALAMHMLYHVPDVPRGIAELRRVVRPGGSLLAATNGAEHTIEITETVAAAASGVGGRYGGRHYSFTLENGAALLSASFAEVVLESHRDVVEVPAGPVIEYVASLEPEYCGVRPGKQWEEFLSRASELVTDRVRRYGSFAVTAHTGTFLCR